MAGRVTFFEEQARYRRATWRWTLAAALAVALMGVPLSIVLTPLVYTMLMIVLRLLGSFVNVPAALWTRAETIAQRMPTLFAQWEQGPIVWTDALTPAIALVLPGSVALVLVWAFIRHRMAREPGARIIAAVRAREPDTTDLEERQLQNILEEMALAAGMPVPMLRIVDGHSANVAVLGSTPDRALVLVARRVLDLCDRSETQGLLAHALAYIAHGDLAIADRIESVDRTSAALYAIDLTTNVDKTGRQTTFDNVKHFVLMPFYLLNLAVVVITGLMHTGLIAPVFRALWRTRRYLADATAVQLTRDPADLSRALEKLGNEPQDSWAVARLQSVLGGDAPPRDKRVVKLAAHRGVIPPAGRTFRRPSVLELFGVIVIVPVLALFLYLMVMIVAGVTLLAAIAMSILMLLTYNMLAP